jgi:hypothetical protein
LTHGAAAPATCYATVVPPDDSTADTVVPTRARRESWLLRAARFPWRMFFLAVIVVAVAVVVLKLKLPSGGVHIPPPSTSRVEVRPTPNVLVAIRDLARLETVTFHMERVVDIADHQTQLFGLVRNRDSLLLIAVGDVVAGIDLEHLRPEDVTSDFEHHRVRLRLPAPEVFSATLDETQTRVYSRRTDTFASRREDLEERARRDAATTMRRAAVEAGILTRARTSGERSVRSLVHSLGFEDIQIEWRTAP